MRLLLLPIAVFCTGATLLGAGVLLAIEVASAIGAVVIGSTFVGLIVRS